MIYVFCDEYIEEGIPDWRYRYSSVDFFQSSFKAGISRIINLREGGKSLLQQIDQALKDTGGLVLLSQAQIPASRLQQVLSLERMIFQECRVQILCGL